MIIDGAEEYNEIKASSCTVQADGEQAGPSQVEAFENEKGRMHSLRLFCSFSIFLMNSVMVVVHQNGASK